MLNLFFPGIISKLIVSMQVGGGSKIIFIFRPIWCSLVQDYLNNLCVQPVAGGDIIMCINKN